MQWKKLVMVASSFHLITPQCVVCAGMRKWHSQPFLQTQPLRPLQPNSQPAFAAVGVYPTLPVLPAQGAGCQYCARPIGNIHAFVPPSHCIGLHFEVGVSTAMHFPPAPDPECTTSTKAHARTPTIGET